VSGQPTVPADGYCWRCTNRGEVTVRGTVSGWEGEPEPREWTVACPECSPPPSAREVWLEAVALAEPEP
jgi:hypothetical protein